MFEADHLNGIQTDNNTHDDFIRIPLIYNPSSNAKREQSHLTKQLKIPDDLETNIQKLLLLNELTEDVLQKLPDATTETVSETFAENQIDALLMYSCYKGDSELVAKLAELALKPSLENCCSQLNALHLAICGGHTICVENILLKSKFRRDWLEFKFHGFSLLQFAIFFKNQACIKIVLHYLKLEDILESELNKESEHPGYTALHIAALQDLPEIASQLVEIGAETEAALKTTNHTPLHLAALNKSTLTARVLIEKGASLRALTDQGLTTLSLVATKIPRALDSIIPMLDSLITLNEDHEKQSKTLVLDFTKLQASRTEFRQNLLSCFVTSSQSKFLQHPLCQILLDENWDRVRAWFFARLFFCALWLLTVTVYIVAFHASACTKPQPKYNFSSISCNGSTLFSHVDQHQEWQIFLAAVFYMVVPLTIFDICRKLAGFFSFAKSPSTPTIMRTIFRYVKQFDNYFEWFCLVTTLFLFYGDHEENTWQKKVAPLVILVSWANFMILLGQIPWFGVYVEMYISVLKEFLKLLSAYVCLLIGYSISFFMIFKKEQPFSDPLKAIWKTLAMMTGELEYNDLFETEGSSSLEHLDFVSSLAVQIIFMTFLFTIAIVLMNLLVGIVVHDVNEIKKSALATMLRRKVELVEYLETTSENIKLIFRKAFEIVKLGISTIFCKHRKIKKVTERPEYIKEFTQPKDGDFESEVKRAAMQIAQVNLEMKMLYVDGDEVDGTFKNRVDTLENKLRRNNIKLKQLMVDLNALIQENSDIALKLKK